MNSCATECEGYVDHNSTSEAKTSAPCYDVRSERCDANDVTVLSRRLGDVGAAPLLPLAAAHVDHFRRTSALVLPRATSVPARTTNCVTSEQHCCKTCDVTCYWWWFEFLRRCLLLPRRTLVHRCASSQRSATTIRCFCTINSSRS